ncbi:ENR1 protein, partial [Gymnorhina tibicen]|nr:ENR1 protein [Gymnorhina tibicen]
RGVSKKGPRIQTLGGKQLFLDLAERISHAFNITDCWICGDTQMAEIWPWEGLALNPQEMLKLLAKEVSGRDERSEEEVWNLRSEIIGEECLWRRG